MLFFNKYDTFYIYHIYKLKILIYYNLYILTNLKIYIFYIMYFQSKYIIFIYINSLISKLSSFTHTYDIHTYLYIYRYNTEYTV